MPGFPVQGVRMQTAGALPQMYPRAFSWKVLAGLRNGSTKHCCVGEIIMPLAVMLPGLHVQ
jgi:hypothetical protein